MSADLDLAIIDCVSKNRICSILVLPFGDGFEYISERDIWHIGIAFCPETM